MSVDKNEDLLTADQSKQLYQEEVVPHPEDIFLEYCFH